MNGIPPHESHADRAVITPAPPATGQRDLLCGGRMRVASAPQISPSDASASEVVGTSRLPSGPRDGDLRIRLQQAETSRSPLSPRELGQLFDAVSTDDADTVVRLLRRAPDPDVRHPENGHSLLFAVADARAWRVLQKLESFEQLVDPLIRIGEEANRDGVKDVEVRAANLAARHAQSLDQNLMWKWHWLTRGIALYGSSSRELCGSSRLGRPEPLLSDDGQGAPLKDPEELMDRLRELFDRLTSRHDIPMPEVKHPATELRDLDVTRNDGLRARLKTMLDIEGETLRSLSTDLERWNDFIERLMRLARRPLPDPNLGTGTVYDSATLSEDGTSAPLIATLLRRLTDSSLEPMDEQAERRITTVLDALIDERVVQGAQPIRMTRQHVQMAQELFEMLPLSLLQDSDSFVPEVRKVLAAADKAHGGREVLRRTVHVALEAKPAAKGLTAATVARYRRIRTYLALEQQGSESMKILPAHLMTACLIVARKYAGRRDSDLLGLKLARTLGDKSLAKVAHAELRIILLPEFRLAAGHLSTEAVSRPNTLLYAGR